MIYIYGLVDRSAEVKGIRYIGLTSNPQSRLTAHRESTEATTKAAWINELALSGSTVDMVILDQAESRENAHRLEASWIKFAESRCWELTNTIRPSGECMALPDVDSEMPHATAQVVRAIVHGDRLLVHGFPCGDGGAWYAVTYDGRQDGYVVADGISGAQ